MKALFLKAASLAVLAATAVQPAFARPAPADLSLADSFRIGDAGVLCTAQSRLVDPALSGMFDRAHAIFCRDAAAEVGKLYQLRGGTSGLDKLASSRRDPLDCDAEAPAGIAALPGAMVQQCRLGATGLRYVIYRLEKGRTAYVAEGLAGYDSALRLGLQSILSNRPVSGAVEVAATQAGDATAFARIQAGNLDEDQALSEGYGRNNSGNYAEASEFFDVLVQRSRAEGAGHRSAEYLANQGLQESNLGNFAAAESLFNRADAAADRTDPVVLRLTRNFRAMNQLNQRHSAAAIEVLSAPLPEYEEGAYANDRLSQGFLDRPITQQLNYDAGSLARIGGLDNRLTASEKVAILDAQADFLRGSALRQQGNFAPAREALAQAADSLARIRGGKVSSVLWLRADSLTQLAYVAEAEGKGDEARGLLEQSVRLYETDYPNSAALLSARATLAGFLMRQKAEDEARTLYRSIIDDSGSTPGSGPTLRGQIGPYFGLLVDRSATDPSAAADFFAASQILVRPGVAQTQAVLARELSGGSDQAAALFRQSLGLTRDIIRTEAEVRRLETKPELTDNEGALLAGARTQLDTLRASQTAVTAQLADFPRYRAIDNGNLGLDKLEAALGDGEAYYKLTILGEDAFGLLVTKGGARAFRIDIPRTKMAQMVLDLRASIVRFENGAPVTEPFDLQTARALYVGLFTPVEDALPGIRHLIFEPDGPMLQLPVNLLPMRQADVDAYQKKIENPDADPFDMTGIDWLGRERMVSTAVSARGFIDVRSIPASKAKRAFLGLGQNAVTTLAPPPQSGERDRCDWPLAIWDHPILADELRIGAQALGEARSEVITDAAFTDDALRTRTDLNDFHVLHFATHGLVSAPRKECPARPALLTSFGGTGSDGLLSFREIFDLKLDADTIVLSACDTAGEASVAATREAGVATGGGYPLDGLVRAFVAAGARSVIASHWPLPDDFGATKALITGLYTSKDQAVGESLRESELRLMDAPDTSHPYYWSGFALVGDGAKPLMRE